MSPSSTILFLGALAAVAAGEPRALPAQQRAPAAQSGAELHLPDVLARAVTKHPLLEAARARVAAAHGTRRTAGALPNPIFTYSVENVSFPGKTSAVPLERETQSYATLPLEPLFQRWSRVRGANAGLRAAEADFVRARQIVALDAARAFYRVAEAQVAVDAADEVQARLGELEKYNAARVREGVTAEADLIRTQVELSRVEATGTLARVDLARARAELAPFIDAQSEGGSPRTAFRVAIDAPGDDGARPAALASLPVLLATARTQRADVIAARERLAAARSEVTSQRTLAVRQLGATFGSKRTAGMSSMLAGLSLPIPLFDQNRGEVQRASAERMIAEQELVWAERQSAADVEAAYESTRLLAEQRGRLHGSFLERAEESRRIALAAYQDGAISLLQVLDASRTLADARQTYYRTIFAQRQSLLELRAAVGEDVIEAAMPVVAPSPTTIAPRAQSSGDDRQ